MCCANRRAAIAFVLGAWFVLAFVVEAIVSVLFGPLIKFAEHVYTKYQSNLFAGVFVGTILAQVIFVPFALSRVYLAAFGYSVGRILTAATLLWHQDAQPFALRDHCACFTAVPVWLTLCDAGHHTGITLGLFFAWPHLSVPALGYFYFGPAVLVGAIGGLARIRSAPTTRTYGTSFSEDESLGILEPDSEL